MSLSTWSPAVVLVQLPGACRQFTRSGSLYPPLGLCQLAATVEPERCVVLDADAERWTWAETVEAVWRLRPRLVGLTVTSFTVEMVEAFTHEMREAGIPVVVGGPHATLAPDDTMRSCPSVTYAVRGEAELLFPEMVGRVEKGESLVGLPGVCHREGQQAVVDPHIHRVADFHALPFPRFDGLPVGRWWCPDARRRPMVTMMTARGCPHRCGFCSSPTLLGRKVRGPSVDRVVDELERLVECHHVREISFVDDVYSLPRPRALALCRGISARGLDLSWFCNARADQVDPELAEAMAAAGCHQVYLGFESGSDAILQRIQKGTTVERLMHGAETLRAAGINRSVGFVIGLPGESDETIDMTMAVAAQVQPERVQFTRFTALMGSPLADELQPGASPGFHGVGGDQVAEWIARCYASTTGRGWGAASV